jgi:hypothetical protein
MKKQASAKAKDLKVRKDGAVKGGSTVSETLKNFGNALSTVARKS